MDGHIRTFGNDMKKADCKLDLKTLNTHLVYKSLYVPYGETLSKGTLCPFVPFSQKKCICKLNEYLFTAFTQVFMKVQLFDKKK